MRIRRLTQCPVAMVIAVGLVCGACSSGGSAPADADRTTKSPGTGDADNSAAEEAVYPGAEWARARAADVDLDQAPLDELTTFLEEQKSDCFAVIKDGRLVVESYWNGFDASRDREVFSASKSVTSTLVGIAQDNGLLDIDEPASKYITEWQGTDSESVTIKNLISNDSGRAWDYATDYTQMALSEKDKTGFAIGLSQQHPPGEHWEYNNSAIQTLEAVLERATRQDVLEFAQEHLFKPLGMEATIGRDPAGNALTFMGVQAGCLDLARFGYLFLRQGEWAGKQVVSSDWVEEATSPSQDLNRGYGYLWWLNSNDDSTPTESAFAPELKGADGAYAALGLFDQIVLVLPEQDMVVVRLGAAETIQPGEAGILERMADLTVAADRTGS